MEGAAPALLAQLAAATSLAGELDVADAGGDDAPPVLRVTPASRAAWSAIFRQHVMGARRGGDTDDMLFFVRVPANQIEPFFALRHDSKQVPPPEAADVNWEESCYLNLIMHNLEYTMEESKYVSKVLGAKVSKKVYAAPNHAPIDGKSKAESMELTYPFVYFRVDDHDEIWRDVLLQEPDQIIAVELFAQGPIVGTLPPAGAPRHKLFSGALSFEAIQRAVREKSSAFSLSGPPAQHFFKLRGPRGKGTAQLCVKRPGAEAATGLGAWALSLLRSSEEDAAGPFQCSITWLSVSWHSIMRDLLRSGAAAP